MKKFKIPNDIQKQISEFRHRLNETGIPPCMKCGKPMKNAYDTRMKKISPYLWEYDCDCHQKNVRISIG